MTVYLPKRSRFWAYDFQHKGRRFHGSTGVESKRAAEAVERRMRQEAALGRLDDGQDMTWDEAAGQWWIEVGRHRASARQLEHRLDIALRLIGRTGRIRDTTTATVARAIEKRRGEVYSRGQDTDDGKARRYALKNATVNADVVKPLQRVLNRARKVWGVKDLPEIDWGALILPEPESEIRIYTAAQQSAWLAVCDPTSRFVLRLLLTYGLRFSEVFFPPSAFIPDAPGGPVLAINKRKRGVLYLPLRADDARHVAARVGRAQALGMKTIFFERKPGGKHADVTPAAIQSRLRKAGEKAGMGDMRRLIHGTRHHVGTTTLAQTDNLKLTQQLLGHADIKSTLRYAHALSGDLRAALESRNSPGAPDADTDFSAPDQPRRRKTP